MGGRPENEFPTIGDFATCLQELVERGLGDLPVQILVAPDSTIQALARVLGPEENTKPALMVQLKCDGGRIPVSLISTDQMQGRGMPSRVSQ